MIKLEISFPPVSWTPSRICKTHSYNPKDKEKKALSKIMALMYNNNPILKEYVVIDFEFRFEPPKSASKKERAAMLSGEIIPTKSDCTNLQKFAEDCLKKIVIEDDRLVARISSAKLYAEKESITIQIQTLKEYRDATKERDIQKNNREEYSRDGEIRTSSFPSDSSFIE